MSHAGVQLRSAMFLERRSISRQTELQITAVTFAAPRVGDLPKEFGKRTSMDIKTIPWTSGSLAASLEKGLDELLCR